MSKSLIKSSFVVKRNGNVITSHILNHVEVLTLSIKTTSKLKPISQHIINLN